VLEFAFAGERRRFWIVKDSAGPSVCTHDPGFDIDVLVRADLATLYEVRLGRLDLRTAIRDRSVELLGAPSLIRRAPDLFLLSPVADPRGRRRLTPPEPGRVPSGGWIACRQHPG
jgi:hypothetical protein